MGNDHTVEERPHSCEFALEVAQLSEDLRKRERRYLNLSDEADSLRRKLAGCDAGRKQQALNCPAFVGPRNTHPEINGTCSIDNNEPCLQQCRKKNVIFDPEEGVLVHVGIKSLS